MEGGSRTAPASSTLSRIDEARWLAPNASVQGKSEVGFGEFVEAVAGILEFALSAQLDPDFAGELVGGLDGKDAVGAGGEGAVADLGIGVEGGELEAFFEGLEGGFEGFGRDAAIWGRLLVFGHARAPGIFA